jgi:hypothetical protein
VILRKIIFVEGLDCAGKTTYIKDKLMFDCPTILVNYSDISIEDNHLKINRMIDKLSSFRDLCEDKSFKGNIIFDRATASTEFYSTILNKKLSVKSHYSILKFLSLLGLISQDLNNNNIRIDFILVKSSLEDMLNRLNAKEVDTIEKFFLDRLSQEDGQSYLTSINNYFAHICFSHYNLNTLYEKQH